MLYLFFCKYTLVVCEIEVFDFETINKAGVTRPLSLAFSNGNKWEYAEILDQTYENAALVVVNNFKNGCYYYAHNLIFDFLQLLPGLLSLNVRFTWVFIDYELYGVKIFYKNKTINLRCSFKLIPYPLERFFPLLTNRPKLFFPYSTLSNWDSRVKCTEFEQIDQAYSGLALGEYLKIYATNDVKILKEGLLNFFLNLKEIGISFNKNLFSCGGIALKYYLSR